jgi:heat shock protein 5
MCATLVFWLALIFYSYQHPGGRVEIIANDQGHRITPSWVSFGDGERLVGDAAKHAFHTNPENTVFDAKRLIGRKLDDADVQRDMKHWCVYNALRRPRVMVMRANQLVGRSNFWRSKASL